MPSHAFLVACAASALAVTGCTITFAGDPAQQPPPPPAAPAARAPAQPPGTAKPPPASKPPASKPPPAKPAEPDKTPRMTSPNAFGRSVASAFTAHAYVIPDGTTALPKLDSMIPFARFWADDISVAPQDFAGGFPGALAQDEWFALRYEGNFEVPSDGDWAFKLGSDDGAVLWIDGAKVIDNDGQHAYKEATGKAQLKAGPHRLRLDYFQAKKGSVALELWIVKNGKDEILPGVR